MDQSDLIIDLSDDDEDIVVRTIELQKSLISESQSLSNRDVETNEADRVFGEPHGADHNDARTAEKDDEMIYRDALAANVEYDNYLARLESNLKTLISECKSNLEELHNIREGQKRDKRRYSLTGRNNYLYIFGAPYFKDKDYYPCPPNADTIQKTQNNELCLVDLPTVHWWTPLQTKQLVDGIKDMARQTCIREAQSEKNALLRRCTALGENDPVKPQLRREIHDFDVKEVAQAKLNDKIATMDHDWLKLSASTLNGRHSADECRGFWNNYLHPKYHKGKWTMEEEEKLRQLAEENNFQNWDLIAEELGTKRSGYQCFAHFRSGTIESLKQKWTKEEDDMLMAVVERLRVGNYIPWSRVAVNMKDRSKTQVYNRWSYSLNPTIKKGRFTIAEDIVILCGIQKWGEDFQKIALYIPDRTAPQIRARYVSGLCRTDFAPWTLVEDKAILQLVRKYGHNWVEIAKHLPGKASVQIRRRHETLQKWVKAHPGKELAAITSRRNLKNSFYDRYPELWASAEKLLSGGNPKAQATSLYQHKGAMQVSNMLPRGKRSRKRTSIDIKLREYFEGAYQAKPRFLNQRKFTDCDAKLIGDVASFLELLGAKLAIPPDDELEQDKNLDEEDKQVLKGLRNFHPEVLYKKPPFVRIREHNCVITEDPDPVLYKKPPFVRIREHNCVITEDPDPVDPPNHDIDYVPKASPSSTLVQLDFGYEYNLNMDAVLSASVAPRVSGGPEEPAHPLFGYLKYLCPPNLSTLVGLRSILLGKRRLVESISEFATDPILSDVDSSSDGMFQQASQLWEDRLMCLFALPNLLTRIKPDKTVKTPGTRGLPPLRGVSLDSEIEAVPGTSGVFNVGSLVSEAQGMLNRRQQAPERKRQNKGGNEPKAKKQRQTEK